jgi:hypothetical protein
MSNEAFADVEAAVMSWLGGGLTEYVGDQVPSKEQRPGIVVIRLGGPRINVAAEDATVTIEAWAQPGQWPAAHALILRARQRMHAVVGTLVDGVTFVKVSEFAGPGRLIDPVSGAARYVMTFSLRVRTLAPTP